MSAQTVIVALLVIGCTVYAAWTLMPAVARRHLAQALLRLPLPAPARAPLEKAITASGGCSCSGCDAGPQKKPAASDPQPIRFLPRGKR